MKLDHGDPDTYAVIGSAIGVHQRLGCGFLEAVYREALQIEFEMSHIPYLAEEPLPIRYRGQELRTRYRPDFICFGRIIVEVKALRTFTELEMAQVINYLKASNLKLGLLLNFGNTTLTHRRLIHDTAKSVLIPAPPSAARTGAPAP